MARTPVNGLKLAIAATYDTAKVFTSASNAAECVLSFASDPGLAAGNIIEVSSGWQRLDGRVVRVKTITGAGPFLVTLEGINTTSTTQYPAGSGAGSIREVLTWSDLSQVLDVETAGGAQNFLNFQYIDEDEERSLPTNRGAATLGVTVHNDEAAAWVAVVEGVQESGALAAVRLTNRAGGVRYSNVYWSIAPLPTFAKNDFEQRRVDLALQGRSKFYAS